MNNVNRRTMSLLVIAAIAAVGCKRKGGNGYEAEESDRANEQGDRFLVPSDPKATYYVLERTGTTTRPVLTTKRVGPSGASYARRECDCEKRTFRYLSEGDTLEELEASPELDEKMSPLVEGSIADVTWHVACADHVEDH